MSISARFARTHTNELTLALIRQEEILGEARLLLLHREARARAGTTYVRAIELPRHLADALTLQNGIRAHGLPATTLLHFIFSN